MPDPNTAASLGSDGFPKSGWTPPGDAPKAPPAAAEPPPPPPVADLVPAAPKPKARLAPRAGLEERIAFDFPVEFDGKTYDAVTVRRLSVGDLARFMEDRGDAPRTGAVFRYPMYFDDAGEPMPDEVLDAVEVMDHAKVVKATERFLPPNLGGVEV